VYQRKSLIRYYTRTNVPSIGFIPWGLLGIIFIIFVFFYGTFWFAKQDIEKNTKKEVLKILHDNKLSWVGVDASGQDITLHGTGPIKEGERAIALAKKASADTWAGRLTAPIRVTGHFTQATEKSDPNPPTSPTKIEPIHTIEPWGNLIATTTPETLVLQGTVSSDVQKNKLLSVLDSTYRENIMVVDEINISVEALADGSLSIAKRVIQAAPHCIEGKISAVDGVFSLSCQTSRSKSTLLNNIAKPPLANGTIGSITISTRDDCNKEFKQLLNEKTIGFASNSDTLKPGSEKLLDAIASLANQCLGTIRIDGHTDDTGNFDSNMQLSEDRAFTVVKALVDRNIARERLHHRGLGSTQPRAQGTSTQARALNRRIEFHVLDKEDNQ